MKIFFAVFFFLAGAAAAQEIPPEKLEAIDRLIVLSKNEEGFKIGLKAGLDAGFSADNPGFAAMPPEKLEKLKTKVFEIMEENFTFKQLRPVLVQYYHEQYTLEELKILNEKLEDPVLQKYLQKSLEMVPLTTKASMEVSRELDSKIMNAVMEIMSE